MLKKINIIEEREKAENNNLKYDVDRGVGGSHVRMDRSLVPNLIKKSY